MTLLTAATPDIAHGIDLRWLSYVGPFLLAWVALRQMPNKNTETVGSTLGALVDRLQAENQRLQDEIEHERTVSNALRTQVRDAGMTPAA